MAGNKMHLNEDEQMEVALWSRMLPKKNADVFLGNIIESYENKNEDKDFLVSCGIIRDVALLAVFHPEQFKDFSITKEKADRLIDIVKNELNEDILDQKKRPAAESHRLFKVKKIAEPEDSTTPKPNTPKHR